MENLCLGTLWLRCRSRLKYCVLPQGPNYYSSRRRPDLLGPSLTWQPMCS